jgi:DNA-binding LytR/AlgR family response regulator
MNSGGAMAFAESGAGRLSSPAVPLPEALAAEREAHPAREPSPPDAAQNGAHGPVAVAGSRTPAVLPVRKERVTHYLPVAQILAVKADAHYTTVFDGTNQFFCPMSITDVEQRLGRDRFIRVHRSHIVAVDRIAALKRCGDGGIALLDRPTPYRLPVSRRKLPELKAILDAR